MKKTFLLVLAVGLIVALVAPAAMAAVAGLTDEQEAELAALYEMLLELRKQIIQKRVEFGILSPEQGQYMMDWTDEMWQHMQEYGYGPRWGYGRGFGGGPMGFGGGWHCPMGGYYGYGPAGSY